LICDSIHPDYQHPSYHGTLNEDGKTSLRFTRFRVTILCAVVLFTAAGLGIFQKIGKQPVSAKAERDPTLQAELLFTLAQQSPDDGLLAEAAACFEFRWRAGKIENRPPNPFPR
jgi:hypothetical protein